MLPYEGLAYWNNALYVAYGNLTTGELEVAVSTNNGQSFSNPTTYSSIVMSGNPSLAVFNGVLYAAYRCNCSSYTLTMTYTTDGVHFATPFTVGSGGGYQSIGEGLALASYQNQLWMVWYDRYSGSIDYSSTANPTSWGGFAVAGPEGGTSVEATTGPGLAVYGDTLYLGYRDASTHELVVGLFNGTYWTDYFNYPSLTMDSSPVMSGWFDGFIVAYRGTSDLTLYVSNCQSVDSCSAPTIYSNIEQGVGGAAQNTEGELFLSLRKGSSPWNLYTTNNLGD